MYTPCVSIETATVHIMDSDLIKLCYGGLVLGLRFEPDAYKNDDLFKSVQK